MPSATARGVGLKLLVVAVLVPGLHAQRPTSSREVERADSIARRMAHLAERAPELAGCFTVREQVTWTTDSLRFPTTFELLPVRYRDLGYHRLFSFATDLDPLDRNGYPPIWSVREADSVRIEPKPSPVGGPYHDIILVFENEGDRFRFETRWHGPTTPLPGSRGPALVGRGWGSREPCEG